MELVTIVIIAYVLMYVLTSPSASSAKRIDMTDEDVLREQLDDLWVGQNK